jgi:hypothetical protein
MYASIVSIVVFSAVIVSLLEKVEVVLLRPEKKMKGTPE